MAILILTTSLFSTVPGTQKKFYKLKSKQNLNYITCVFLVLNEILNPKK